MDTSEITFNCRLFKDDPIIRAVKKQLTYKTSDHFLMEYIVNKKLLFIINRKYFTYKLGYLVTYEDHERQGQLRVEKWMEIEKGIQTLTMIGAIKNNTPEGECLKLSW
jgi:hypothetical protein